MSLTNAQVAEIEETLDRYRTAYMKKDLDGIVSLFSPDVTGYGSGQDEVIRNRDDYARLVQRDLSQAASVFIEFPDLKISGKGPVALVAARCICTFMVAGRKQTMDGRMTLALKNTGSRWLIGQYHFSMPNTEQAPGQAFSG
jgi:ketosteroid isomerase-like protein